MLFSPLPQSQPLFTLLSHHWTGYQDEVVLLSVLSSLLPQLAQFIHASHSLVQEDAMTALLDQAPCPSDEERMTVQLLYRITFTV